MLTSNAYRALTPNARALLVELVMLHNGENNGSLYLGVRDAAYRMGVADVNAASRAFNELQNLGFIEMTQDAHFHIKASHKSRARCWRLTWLEGPGRKRPGWNFLELEPEPKTPARKRMERGLRVLKTYRRAKAEGRLPVSDFETLDPIPFEAQRKSVLESNTPNLINGRFPAKGRVLESSTHIAGTIGACAIGSAKRAIDRCD